MFPRPPSTQIMKVSGPKAAAEERMHRVLDDEQRPGQAGHGAAHRGGDDVHALRVGAHEAHGVAVLGHGADGGAHEGARQEEVEADHGQDGHGEGDEPREGAGRSPRSRWWAGRGARVRWSVVQRKVANDWRKKRRPAGGEELVDGRAREDGRDDQQVHGARRGGRRAPSDARPASQIGQPYTGHEEVDPVHAQHDEVHVHDPDDVEHAEDQVEPEREEREDAAEQDAVQRGLEEEDGVDQAALRIPYPFASPSAAAQTPTYAFRTKSCSASSAARPSILMRPTSRR